MLFQQFGGETGDANMQDPATASAAKLLATSVVSVISTSQILIQEFAKGDTLD